MASKLTRGRTEKMDMVQKLSEEGTAFVVFPQLWNETFWEGGQPQGHNWRK